MASSRGRILVVFSLLALSTSCAHRPNPWRAVENPLPGAAHIYGTVNGGCVAGAENLATAGLPLEFMNPSRNRYYGHPVMAAYLRSFSERFAKTMKARLFVGDVAQPRGGPTGVPGKPASHSSPQTGLDADIWFGEKGGEPIFLVNADDETMTNHWNLRFYEGTLRLAASYPDVDRIFVNPAIKRELCLRSREIPDQGEPWLRKIRPWWEHKDHFHVRLKCPETEKDCRPAGDPIPPGDGCDETLNWWFSQEAKDMIAQRAASPAEFKMPDLPRECESLLPVTAPAP